MRLKSLLLLLGLALFLSPGAQRPTAEQFLGYSVGSRYTPHHQIVGYFERVAATASDRVRLEPYGRTNEGRPLLVAYVSSPENIARLEAIRTNNQALAQNGGSGTVQNAPAIVWLSYNVHGNETSSSEAALRTLQELTDPANSRVQGWLRNTVVIIDPCLNPDGRDRYVNWFNTTVGKRPNALLSAREHAEPWPGGRVNHYYFDLNRDWAWQTQVESQARAKVFHRWLPQIHVDFHEQGINSPYYFAPAAEPYHEVITPFQRQFQETIGRNHARYFDQQGWLYFTREIFDLFYPSYGDTYPIYNGAIGMTYEQAGGPAGGAAVLTQSGDTLTLADRVAHHVTTGLSTVEVAAQNAARLLGEFQAYYRTAVAGGHGSFRNYVVKYRPEDEARLEALKQLLQKNEIRFQTGQGGNGRGFSYESGRDETFTVAPRDVVISALQPRSALLRVLFEPNPRLSDSATYDITAWALPYVYGLRSYATREGLTLRAQQAPVENRNADNNAFGYVVRWNGFPAARFAGQLLQAGVRVRFAQKPFEAAGQRYDRGSLILLREGNRITEPVWEQVRRLADSSGVVLQPVNSAMVDRGLDFGSSSVRLLRAPRVALLSGEGTSNNAVGEVWHYFEQYLDYPVTLINTSDFGRVDLSPFTVLVLPNGNYRFLNDKAMAEQLRNWVNRGGKLIALEGAVAQLASLEWGIKTRKSDDSSDNKDPYAALRRYEDREREELPYVTPGSIYRVELDPSHPLAFGYPSLYYTLKQEDRVYDFLQEGWNVGVIKRERPVAGFVGAKLQPRVQDGLVFGVQDMGNGQVVYLADDVLFRNFWENGKLLFANALFLVGQ